MPKDENIKNVQHVDAGKSLVLANVSGDLISAALTLGLHGNNQSKTRIQAAEFAETVRQGIRGADIIKALSGVEPASKRQRAEPVTTKIKEVLEANVVNGRADGKDLSFAHNAKRGRSEDTAQEPAKRGKGNSPQPNNGPQR